MKTMTNKMKRLILLSTLFIYLFAQAGERVEMMPFGDFETWTVRYFRESKVIGGKQKILYVPAPTDTIRQNAVFEYGKNGNPWSVSNAYAKVAGIEKASGTTYPEKRGDGYCCRMDCKVDGVTAFGIIDLKVFVSGTIFTGKTNEPVTMAGANDPYSVIDMGVPFTKHPIALMLDYKAIVENSNEVTYAKATAHPKKQEGHDEAEFYIYLQQRWEDADGHIYARRVGTAYERISKSVPLWVNDHRVPIRWGDITQQPGFKEYEGLNKHKFKARNSQGRMMPIQEVGYGLNEPTHIIIMLTSGKYEAFIGHEGNTLWVDNIRLVYDD